MTEEDDVDAPPTVVVGSGRIGPSELFPGRIRLAAVAAALCVCVAIAVVAAGRSNCKKVIVNDSNGDPAVAQICR